MTIELVHRISWSERKGHGACDKYETPCGRGFRRCQTQTNTYGAPFNRRRFRGTMPFEHEGGKQGSSATKNIAHGARTRFLMYVPNSELGPFHDRSPCLMFPRSFSEMGYDSTLICASFAGEAPPGIRIVETSLGVPNPRAGGRVRSVAEPFFAFAEIVRQRPDIVIIGPLRSSLSSFLPLVLLHRLIASRTHSPRTSFILKADWSLDPTGLTPLEASLSKGLLILSSILLDLVSIESTCGVSRALRLPYIQSGSVAFVPLASPQGRI